MIPSGIIWSRFDLVCCCRLVAGGRVAGVWGMSGGIVCVCVRARVRVPVGAVLPRTQESDTEGRRHRGVVNKKNNKKNNLVINGLTAVSRFSWIYLCFGGGVVVVVFWFCVCVCVCVRGACFGLGFSARENANVPKRWQHTRRRRRCVADGRVFAGLLSVRCS